MVMYDLNREQLSAEIKKLRTEAGLSLTKVSEMMSEIDPDFKTGRQWVHHAETGKRNLTIRRLQLLFEALGARLEVVVGREGERAIQLSDGSSQVWEKINGMEEGSRRRERLVAILQGLMKLDDPALAAMLNLTSMSVESKMNDEQCDILGV